MQLYVNRSLSSPFNSDILTHIHIQFNWEHSCFTYTHTHTHMNTFCKIIAIVELMKYKVVFFKALVFCEISCVYVACANLCCIIVELTPEVLLFTEPRELLFLNKIIYQSYYINVYIISFVFLSLFNSTISLSIYIY